MVPCGGGGVGAGGGIGKGAAEERAADPAEEGARGGGSGHSHGLAGPTELNCSAGAGWNGWSSQPSKAFLGVS